MLLELPTGGGGGGAAGTAGTFWLDDEETGGGGGMLDWMNGEEDMGMEARGGLGGRAGRTVAWPDWTLALIRFSISSMSDWDDA